MFQEPLSERGTQRVTDIARKYDVELRYWQVSSTHLYVFKVPWNRKSSGNLDEPIYEALQQEGLGRFDLGYASDYEFEVYRQEILYWPSGSRSRRSRGDRT